MTTRASLLAALALGACAGPPRAEAPGATATASAPVAARTEAPLPPSLAYPELFERVALSALLEPKDWTDAVPLRPVAEIEAEHRAAAPMTDEALAAFVAERFAPPGEVGEDVTLPEGLTLTEHVEALWPVLTRGAEAAEGAGTLLPLPRPYLVPGGRFREAYYWDTYFTMIGLGAERQAIREDVVANFAASLAAYGRVPNGNRSYYLSRSQPPFFYLMVGLLDEDSPERAWADHLKALRTEHAFWTAEADGLLPGESRGRSAAMPDGAVLQRYWDDRDAPRDESYRYDVETAAGSGRPAEEVYRDLRAGAESGWDFSSRWLADGRTLGTIETTSVVPVDLNALLYGLERAIEAGCTEAGDAGCAEAYGAKAEARAEAVERWLWDEGQGRYDDFDLDEGAVRGRATAAMLYPLFTGLAAPERAARTLDAFEAALLAPGGVLPTPRRTGEQWDAPNGWAPHQWIAVRAALGAGEEALAEEVARRWVQTVARGYCESGKLVEKYDVVDAREGGGGEYPNQDGFGWTNGVTVRLIEAFPALAPLGETVVAADPSACAELAAPPAR